MRSTVSVDTISTLAMVGAPTSRTDLVVQEIRRAILDGSLRPGEALSERELANRLGVSKTPVRDALRLLQTTGLVEISSFQQVVVRRIDKVLVAELYCARSILEPSAVGLAVSARGSGRLQEARDALEQSADANATGDLATLSLCNRRFHRSLYAACGNRFLIDELDRLQDLTAMSATLGWRRKSTSGTEADQHVAILDAFEGGDRRTAERLSRSHVQGAQRTLLSTLGDPSEVEAESR